VNFERQIEKLKDIFTEYSPKVVSALLILVIGLWVIKRVAFISQRTFEKRNLDVSLRTFLKSLISIGLKIVLIVTVAGMLGIGTASFVTILGAAGLAVGLALQGSLSNFAGGVLLMIFKPYKVGDTIEAQGQTGEVKEIQIFNTIVLTGDQKTVIFPNGALSNGTIVNYTRHGSLRANIDIAVSSDNDVDKVKAVIREVLEGNNRILKNPEPQIIIGRVADAAIQIQVRPYCLPDDMGGVVSDVNSTLKSAFEKKNIHLPVPYMMVKNLDN